MQYTSSEVAKLLRCLNEEHDTFIGQENLGSTFIVASGEDVESLRPEYRDYAYYGGNGTPQANVEWQVSDYFREGYEAPFAQLVLIENAQHTPHDYHARIAWDFFSRFSRNEDGTISERK